MTINHVFKTISKVMNVLGGIDLMSIDHHRRVYNQRQLNEAYKILDNFKDELIREDIKNKQRRSE